MERVCSCDGLWRVSDGRGEKDGGMDAGNTRDALDLFTANNQLPMFSYVTMNAKILRYRTCLLSWGMFSVLREGEEG